MTKLTTDFEVVKEGKATGGKVTRQIWLPISPRFYVLLDRGYAVIYINY